MLGKLCGCDDSSGRLSFNICFFNRQLIGGGSLAGFLLLGWSGVCLVNEVVDGSAVVVVEGGVSELGFSFSDIK